MTALFKQGLLFKVIFKRKLTLFQESTTRGSTNQGMTVVHCEKYFRIAVANRRALGGF